ncbi:MAG: N-acyl-D-aspartate/D-glutamate deacylase [Ilumatobacteraceae bacterium]|nr:N-acyl-D-aspartate/D-glutamate deacylase [Ilumatobacteraceae bacterium]
MSEIVIRGGTVIDGTGNPGVLADVAIDGGRVTAIGHGLDGDVVLDATGCVVAPGFIDIHTHYDAQVFWDPGLTPSCFHGVTTVVAGNCGFSIAPTRPEHRDLIARTLEQVEDMDVAALAAGVPWETFTTFPEYLASVEASGLGLNFAAYIGHTALRLFAMGDEAYDRTATADEVTEMQGILHEALDAGAAGFATSFAPTHRGADGKPVPSRLADRAEVEALLGTLGDSGRGVAAFTPGGTLGIDDLYELQPRIGVPFTYTAMLTMPTGSHLRLMDVNRAGWEAGAQVWPQVSPRPLRFSMSMAEPFTLNVNPRFGDLMAGDADARRAAYADPAWREQAVAGWVGATFGIPRWETYEIAESAAHPELAGRRLTEIADERGATPFDVLLDLAGDELTIRVACMVANDDPIEVAKVLLEEHCTLGLSDAGAHVGQLCDAPQATDYLGNWVRDRKLLPIEEAVRRLTSVQADLFGFADRGRLVPGAWADVVVFDPDTVAPGPLRRLADFPAGSERLTADQPTGVRHVLVNGVPIQVDGVHDDAVRPGQLVKPSAR